MLRGNPGQCKETQGSSRVEDAEVTEKQGKPPKGSQWGAAHQVRVPDTGTRSVSRWKKGSGRQLRKTVVTEPAGARALQGSHLGSSWLSVTLPLRVEAHRGKREAMEGSGSASCTTGLLFFPKHRLITKALRSCNNHKI